MKALILAAGRGTRLAPLTDSIPKCLVPVCGIPILYRQLQALQACKITDVIVVAGYEAAVVQAVLSKDFPHVHVIVNQDYHSTNNMYSALLAAGPLYQSPFLMMNADVCLDTVTIQAVLDSRHENAIVVEENRYIEESMKVTVSVSDGRVLHISKEIDCDEAYGSSIDVYRFSADGGKIFFACCEEYIVSRQQRNLWSEVALDEALSLAFFGPCPLSGRWFEIDTTEDLAAAEALFAT